MKGANRTKIDGGDREVTVSSPLTAGWSRKFGPEAELGWLRGGRLTEPIPQWFVDFFVSTRSVAAVRPGDSDNCTMTTIEDNWCLYRLVQLARPKRSLEVGIMRGSSSITIAKALMDAGLECVQTALDIDPCAVTAATQHFKTYGLHLQYSPVVADSRTWLRNSSERWQFVFLDGDHHYDTVAIEFTDVYNKTDPGGVIVLHDTGSIHWGVNEDPGELFFHCLDKELADSAEMVWLDSTSCITDMKLRTTLGMFPTIPQIAAGIAVGYGGLGVVRKIDNRRTMSAERLLSQRPFARPVFTYPEAPASLIRRVARRIASALHI